MATTTTVFTNGQTLTSSALTVAQINSLFQQTIAIMLGVLINYQLPVSLTSGSVEAIVPNVAGLQVGNTIASTHIPAGTTVIAISPQYLQVFLSNAATATAQEIASVTDYVNLNTKVRCSWQTEGAPAWTLLDDIISFQCVEEDNEYNKVRDELNTYNDEASLTKAIEYTRVWRVSLVVRGPNSLDNVRLIKSAIQLGFIHDILAASNLYLMPSVGNGIRVPELKDGQWWERVDISFQFYEQVNESIVIPSVASVEVITSNEDGVQSDIVVTT